LAIKFIVQLNTFLRPTASRSYFCSCAKARAVYYLLLFNPDFIVRIKFNPSSVRWEPSFIILAILHQSRKSYSLTPSNFFSDFYYCISCLKVRSCFCARAFAFAKEQQRSCAAAQPQKQKQKQKSKG
jgi:hypothetical protein